MSSLIKLANQNSLLVLICFTVSTLSCLLVVLTKRWHGRFTLDSTEGIQRSHDSPTPRIGGLPVYLGLLLAWCLSAGEIRGMLGWMLLAALPAFIFGFVEDLTKSVGVWVRLLATMASGVLAWFLTGYSLTRLDLLWIDNLLKFAPASVFMTAFAVGGVANSINIVDGFNGQASLISVIALLGLSCIAISVGDSGLALISLLVAMSIIGFFVINWPMGKIFLGDGGSYFVGFCLAWCCVLLAERHSNVTSFVALLICVHPVTEVIFSVIRRRRRKQNPGHPDRLHLHSLINARYVRRWFSAYSKNSRNSITGLILGLVTVLPVLLAQHLFASTRLAVLGVFAMVVLYVIGYRRVVKFKWK